MSAEAGMRVSSVRKDFRSRGHHIRGPRHQVWEGNVGPSKAARGLVPGGFAVCEDTGEVGR